MCEPFEEIKIGLITHEWKRRITMNRQSHLTIRQREYRREKSLTRQVLGAIGALSAISIAYLVLLAVSLIDEVENKVSEKSQNIFHRLLQP